MQMSYQLFPPVRNVIYYEGSCALGALRKPICAGAERHFFDALPPHMAPQAQNVSEGYFYRIGEIGGCPPPDHPQGYILRIQENGIYIAASDQAGLRYGVDTLCQIISQSAGEAALLRIEDYPVLLNRGLMLDVSRGKVYTREYLLHLAELLGKLRYNVMQLYIEHTFDFSSHPEICAGSDPITAEDIRALQSRCQELGIELQANLQCLGHCRRILTRKEHMELSESAMLWSLCTTSEGAIRLIDELFSDYLPLFDSGWVNICFDEPYDIGKGKSARLGKPGPALYVEFLKKVHALAKKYGKRIMLFGDVFLRHPELFADMPEDVRYLDWCYDPKPHYGTPAVFDGHGVDYWVCPGSGNWNTLFPRLDGCLTNVDRLLLEGAQANAGGMLFTDWNDHGGYAQPAAGYFAYGYAVAAAWTGASQKFDQVGRCMDSILKLPHYSQVVRIFAEIYQLPPIWSKNRSECVMALFDEPIFGKAIRGPEPPPDLKAYDLALPDGVQPVFERHSQHPLRPFFSIPKETCAAIAELAAQAQALALQMPEGVVRDQFCYQAEAFVLMTDKLKLSREIIGVFAAGGLSVSRLAGLEDEVRVMIQRYVHLQLHFIKNWMSVAKTSEIDISLTYFAHIIERLDYLRDWLSRQRELLVRGESASTDFAGYETAGYETLPTY